MTSFAPVDTERLKSVWIGTRHSINAFLCEARSNSVIDKLFVCQKSSLSLSSYSNLKINGAHTCYTVKQVNLFISKGWDQCNFLPTTFGSLILTAPCFLVSISIFGKANGFFQDVLYFYICDACNLHIRVKSNHIKISSCQILYSHSFSKIEIYEF